MGRSTTRAPTCLSEDPILNRQTTRYDRVIGTYGRLFVLVRQLFTFRDDQYDPIFNAVDFTLDDGTAFASGWSYQYETHKMYKELVDDVFLEPGKVTYSFYMKHDVKPRPGDAIIEVDFSPSLRVTNIVAQYNIFTSDLYHVGERQAYYKTGTVVKTYKERNRLRKIYDELRVPGNLVIVDKK